MSNSLNAKTVIDKQGFTLLEMIVVMIIMTAVSAMISMFMQYPLQAYFDNTERSTQVNNASVTLAQMRQELQQAVPGSLRRSRYDPDCLEFLPVINSGRYLTEKDADEFGGDALMLGTADTRFDVAAWQSEHTTDEEAGYMVINHINSTKAEYNAFRWVSYDDRYHINRAAVTSISHSTIAIEKVSWLVWDFDLAHLPSDLEIPDQHHFYIIPAHSVVFSCKKNKLIRTTRQISSREHLQQLQTCPSPSGNRTVLLNDVDCSFGLTQIRNDQQWVDQVTIELQLEQGRAPFTLSTEAYISAIP